MNEDNLDNEKEFQLLLRSLKNASGFHLYLAQYNDNLLRKNLIKDLSKQLKKMGITLYAHHLKKPVESLDDFLPPRFNPQKRSVLSITGLENSFSSVGEPQEFLHRMNYARDLFPSKIPYPMILWLVEGTFKKLIEEAHDFWSWRSGTFYFSLPVDEIPIQLKSEDLFITGKTVPPITYKYFIKKYKELMQSMEVLRSKPDTESGRLIQADYLQQLSKLHQDYSKICKRAKRNEMLEKAIELQLQSLEIKKSMFSENHPEIANSYLSLSTLYSDYKKSDLALEFGFKAVSSLEKIFGTNHPMIAASYAYITSLYINMNQVELAREYIQKTVTIMQRALPDGDPELERFKELQILLGSLK